MVQRPRFRRGRHRLVYHLWLKDLAHAGRGRSRKPAPPSMETSGVGGQPAATAEDSLPAVNPLSEVDWQRLSIASLKRYLLNKGVCKELVDAAAGAATPLARGAVFRFANLVDASTVTVKDITALAKTLNVADAWRNSKAFQEKKFGKPKAPTGPQRPADAPVPKRGPQEYSLRPKSIMQATPTEEEKASEVQANDSGPVEKESGPSVFDFFEDLGEGIV
eukprot:TRINITY_DN39198_c0_g1_i1.p1 TRINITY_DN39198_c0_g1~~TRINITY_DN39198_c0_g1_i1.p1  ORF type:complete len:220 (+),score=54.76 TRINITY_DN39198_c0_g1_i1:82-741(+)